MKEINLFVQLEGKGAPPIYQKILERWRNPKNRLALQEKIDTANTQYSHSQMRLVEICIGCEKGLGIKQ